MKILLITDLYPIKTGDNNSPTTLHNFAFEWIKQGHNVDIIKPNFLLNSFLRKKPFYKTGFYEYDGMKIFNVNYFTPFLFDITQKLKLDESNYDIIVAHMPSGIIFANKLAKTLNKPLVCGVHCSDLAILANPVYKFYFKPQLEDAYKNAKKIACRSFVLQKKFSAIMPEYTDKTFVAASGVELREQGTGNREQPFTAHCPPFTILTCANLIKRKNIDKLIIAVSELDGIKLKIIGDGKELNKLKKLACKLGLPAQQLKFLGKLTHEKVLDEMKKADIFILPSVNETFGMVYLEAMACGCITVCTKYDGIDGIIKDGENGFLCEPTVEGIKETILKIQNSNNLEAIVKKSLETVKKYSPSICAENYLKNIE